ncbi:MAG: hypothetical protein V1725_02555 [archaeon]
MKITFNRTFNAADLTKYYDTSNQKQEKKDDTIYTTIEFNARGFKQDAVDDLAKALSETGNSALSTSCHNIYCPEPSRFVIRLDYHQTRKFEATGERTIEKTVKQETTRKFLRKKTITTPTERVFTHKKEMPAPVFVEGELTYQQDGEPMKILEALKKLGYESRVYFK